MRATLLAFVLAFAGGALAGGPIGIDTSTRLEILSCASGGSADAGAGLGQTLTEGAYAMRITDEDVWVCYAATCASGGERWPVGTIVHISIGRGGQVVSCRSTGSTGDMVFTRTY